MDPVRNPYAPGAGSPPPELGAGPHRSGEIAKLLRSEGTSSMNKVTKTDQEWQAQLSPQEFQITRRAGTEPAFSGVYWDTKTPGIYRCKCCDTPLFDSNTKYDSGSGWPSFYRPICQDAVVTRADNSHFMRRTEVLCAACEAHLGHVFPDGPDPTGLRFCMNSASLSLEDREAE